MSLQVVTTAGSEPEAPDMLRINAPQNSALKRAFDIIASVTLILLFLPVMAAIALAILVKDGAPVFYGHHRIGRNGTPFKCWKFRTMVRNADAELQRVLATDAAAKAEWEQTRKLKQDPRIIPGVGHLLRRSSLDELPQLFNVLAGQMSMVGPRPVVSDELDRYGVFRAHYVSVRPGLTGLWQIGERSDDDYEIRVRKDVHYIENWSLANDLQIILNTTRVPFDQKGAY